ncbi:MAG: lipocalin-like domain-containing protein [Candidatus Sulfobium sp.]
MEHKDTLGDTDYMTVKKLLLACITLILMVCGVRAGEYRDVTPGYKLEFPADFYYRKDFRLQWWYFTGHLSDQRGNEYGYEVTFFVAGVQKRKYKSRFGVDNIYISHFAISDVTNNKFRSEEKADSGAYGFAGAEADNLRVWVGDNTLEGTMKKMHLAARSGCDSIDLFLTPSKPLILNGENGYSRKSAESPLIASYYFSYPEMATEGSLSLGGNTHRVAGESWFDREMSSRSLAKNEAGWDWFSIQLDDGREIMLYLLRRKDGSLDPFSAGTFVFRNGDYAHLSVNDFRVAALDHYRSAKTGIRYPSKWEIVIPDRNVRLVITPLIKDQELTGSPTTGPAYWEGTCKVEGTEKGRAYVELTGY